MRHIFMFLMWFCAFLVGSPRQRRFLGDELNTMRGNLKDEMMVTPNIVGDRLISGKNDWVILAPVMASDDVVHMQNVLQRFCMEHNGGLSHSAESHVCDLTTRVTPSVPMFYKYPTDGPGAADSGWGP